MEPPVQVLLAYPLAHENPDNTMKKAVGLEKAIGASQASGIYGTWCHNIISANTPLSPFNTSQEDVLQAI